jgi:P-type Cu2+ transporter
VRGVERALRWRAAEMTARAVAAPERCLHCGSESTSGPFCCRGCEAVHRLLEGAGLTRYYDLGGGEGHPAVVPASTDTKWLEPIAGRIREGGDLTHVVLDVQGVHCAACVWLIDKVFARVEGGARIVVNPAMGTVELAVRPSFAIERFVSDVEAFGYRFGPPLKRAGRSNDLVWRMGVCIAIAMNTMIFGFAIYCGLPDGPVYRLFHALDFALATASVLIGGSVFFRSSWQSVKQRVLHLDLPIALGIALVFASSTYTYVTRGGATSYFDTLTVFIALMLVGRFLQERVLAKNRAMLLESDGADGLDARATQTSREDAVRCTEVEEGDMLLVGSGDIVPVEARLLEDQPALFSLDWINGESVPRAFAPGALVPAGAFSQGERAVRVRTAAPFESSRLVALLRKTTHRDQDRARATVWHRRLTRIYVVAVLSIAFASFVGWYFATRDLARTLDIVAAVLIVTCPCAFGIATPLAYELAQASLRRFGLFVRTPGFLDRAAEVTSVVFDKTGTLTTGRLVVKDPIVLSGKERALAYALAVRSSHPKSRAIADALAGEHVDARRVREIIGKGLELVEDGAVYRLGSYAWAVAPAAVVSLTHDADVFFTKNGVVLAAIETTEELRADAEGELRALAKDYELYVLSGDAVGPSLAMARRCGIPDDHVYAGRSPEGKADFLRSLGGKRLFVGDGINDSLVAEEAYCAGTPAIDRPFMAARSDFYFVSPGLRPIRAALDTARRLARAVRRNLMVALFYNAITVTLAAAGLMTPLLCAILMPASSLTTVLAAQLSTRTKWRS